MGNYLFHGKRVDNGEWVEGYYVKAQKFDCDDYEHFIIEESDTGASHLVDPNSVGQYTGFDEFALYDETKCNKLFEGDIVEVWALRELYDTRWSQYDGKRKFRGVIVFDHGCWTIDFNNDYNLSICKAHGEEKYDRNLPCGTWLYCCCPHYGKDRDVYRKERLAFMEHVEENYKFVEDIVKIGNVFDNKELLMEQVS